MLRCVLIILNWKLWMGDWKAENNKKKYQEQLQKFKESLIDEDKLLHAAIDEICHAHPDLDRNLVLINPWKAKKLLQSFHDDAKIKAEQFKSNYNAFCSII